MLDRDQFLSLLLNVYEVAASPQFCQRLSPVLLIKLNTKPGECTTTITRGSIATITLVDVLDIIVEDEVTGMVF